MCKTSTHPQACDEETGYKGACGGCPFNEGMTAEADMAQGYGCLPSGYDIIQMKKASGHNWACHSDETKVCSGLCHQAKDRDLDLSQGNLIRYSSWFHAGEQAALDEAETGILVQELTGHYFRMAIEGLQYADGTRQDPTIANPTVKYYHHASEPTEPYDKQKDTRRFWVATSAPELDHESGLMLRRVVGLLELQNLSTNEKVAGLKYISVDPAFQRLGIAKRMLAGMIEYLKNSRQQLSRCTPSEEGRVKIQAYLSQMLDNNGILWTQATSS